MDAFDFMIADFPLEDGVGAVAELGIVRIGDFRVLVAKGVQGESLGKKGRPEGGEPPGPGQGDEVCSENILRMGGLSRKKRAELGCDRAFDQVDEGTVAALVGGYFGGGEALKGHLEDEDFADIEVG